MSVESTWFVTLGSICHGVHLGQERWCVVCNFWAPNPAQVRLLLAQLLQGYRNPFNNSNHSLQQFKAISITASSPGAFGPGFDTAMNSYLCSCSGLPLSTHWCPWGCIYSTWNLISEPQPLPGVYLLWCRLTHSHSHLEVHLCPRGPPPWHWHNWGRSALVWTRSWLWTLWGVLLPHVLTYRSHWLWLTLGSQPVQFSSTEAAAMPWPSASPIASLLVLSECSQAQQSRMISHTAGQHTVKAKSSH